MVLTADGQVRRMSVADTSQPVEAFTRITVPKGFVARDHRARRELLESLQTAVDEVPYDQRKRRATATEDAEIARLRSQLRAHPCHGCNDREVHARWAERYHRTERHARDLERRVEGRTNSIARRFDQVCEVLTELGYLGLVRRRHERHGPRPDAHAPVHRVRPPGGPVAARRRLVGARRPPSWRRCARPSCTSPVATTTTRPPALPTRVGAGGRGALGHAVGGAARPRDPARPATSPGIPTPASWTPPTAGRAAPTCCRS